MRRLVSLIMAAALAVPAVTVAQGGDPASDTPYEEYLEAKLGALEALRDILATEGPTDAAVLAGPVADRYEEFLLATRPAPCYATLYVNDWHVATVVRLLSEVPADQHQDMVDLIADRLAAAPSLDEIDCAAEPPAAPIATTSPPTQFATPAPTAKPKPTKKPSYKKVSARTWSRIVRSPDDHIGETIQLWACIWQFDSRTGKGTFLASASNAREQYWFTDGEDAQFTGPESRLDPFVQGDIVWMNVAVDGAYSYDTAAGGTNTVPTFTVKNIKRKGSCD